MAVEVITAVLRLQPLVVTPPERLVLYVLAWHATRHGVDAYPAVRTIARETSLSRRAVQKILLRLQGKSFIVVDGRKARGMLSYSLNLSALDRERYSQSADDDREPSSQSNDRKREPRSQSKRRDRVREPRSQSEDFSTAINSEPGAPGGEPGSPLGANGVRGGGEPRSPELSLTVLEPSRKTCSGADAPRVPAPESAEANLPVITRLAHEVIDELGSKHQDLIESLKCRCAAAKVAYYPPGDLARRALDSAIWQRAQKAGQR